MRVEKVVIGDLPKKNAYHRLCLCQRCGIIYLGKLHLEFRKFSVRWATGMADPNDGFYVCRECGGALTTEYVNVEVEGEVCK